MSNKKIFLTGFMGCGKSTIGRTLERKGFVLVDMDEAIIKKDGRQISKVFKESGEGYFRLLETMVLKEICSSNEPLVVSCGGGTVLKEENVSLMKAVGRVVYLKARPETILKRVERSNKRPILEGNKNIEFISNLMDNRLPAYERAGDIVLSVDDKTPEEIVTELLTQIN